ncbi:DNA replication/repair protein RecF [bacterium]|nr:DNA replication/repair protein RecF [bacterium]NUN44709.1 DNA replication/repair protein RecF [bacterium]
MLIRRLRLRDFRNYTDAEIQFAPGLNVITGDNGQGKTSLLEAVYYLCLTKSFKTTEDESAIRFNTSYFDIEGQLARDESSLENDEIRLVVHRAEGKSLLVGKKRQDRFSEHIGRFPAVISAPEDVAIVSGAPGNRRRWLDMALSQLYPVYLKDLLDYRQALKQRNALFAATFLRPDLLAVWDRELATVGARIIRRRLEFVRSFAGWAARVYGELAVVSEQASISYKSTIANADTINRWCETLPDDQSIAEAMAKTIAENRDREMMRQTSLIGPHKDELLLLLNDKAIREFGSQGQLKTMALALKLAEFLHMAERRELQPLLLLDDVFSELDWTRRHNLIRYLENAGQVFLTSADTERDFETKRPIRHFKVINGSVSA